MNNNNAPYKHFTLLSLYLAQSIPMSFFSTVIPVIMRLENYSLESIGYMQLIKLPWIIKFLWAPFIDNKCSSRKQYRKWILYSELFYAAVIFSVGFFNLQQNFTTIIVLMLIAFTASATQDIATDAFAILSLKKPERSLGNSMQSAGSFMGTIMGSGVLLIVYHYWGWQYLLVALAVFVLLALLPVSILKLKKESEASTAKKNVSMKDISLFFKQKGALKRVILLSIFYSGTIGILTMLKPYLVDLNFNIKEIGLISGVFGASAGALMAVAAGFIIKKIGSKKSLLLFSSINLIAAIYFSWLSSGLHTAAFIYLGVALLWSAYAMSSVIIYTISMNFVRKGRERKKVKVTEDSP